MLLKFQSLVLNCDKTILGPDPSFVLIATAIKQKLEEYYAHVDSDISRLAKSLDPHIPTDIIEDVQFLRKFVQSALLQFSADANVADTEAGTNGIFTEMLEEVAQL